MRAIEREEARRPGEPADAREGCGRTDVAARPVARDVLVVTADTEEAERLTALIAQEGMRPSRVRSVRDALSALDADVPDALLVAHWLPDGLGYRVVESLRARPQGDLPAAIVFGRHIDFADQTDAIHAGADATFETPLDWALVSRKLHQLIDRTAHEMARVLVVEDEPMHAALARRTLEQAGYQVEVCGDPIEFRDVLSSFQPNLLILDIGLPVVSGYDLARFVRQDEQYAAMPIMFLTAETQENARIRTVQAGGDDFLMKPVPPALLVSSVAARLERARILTMLLTRDGLTQLLTHTSFMEQAGMIVARRRREDGSPASMVMLDIDHFKAINDRHGHPAGDRVLKTLAGVVRRHIRRSDPIGRYGGEEFAIVLEGVSEREAMRLVQRLLDEFREIEHRSGGASFRATFSAGVAGYRPGMDVEAWVNAADSALYHAKRAGRNRLVSAGAP
jgi:diguanylate cyclase (GGDEF)-like protein